MRQVAAAVWWQYADLSSMSSIGSRSRPRAWMLLPAARIRTLQRQAAPPPPPLTSAATAPTNTPKASITQSTETHATHLHDTYWQRRGSLLLLQQRKYRHVQRELRVNVTLGNRVTWLLPHKLCGQRSGFNKIFVTRLHLAGQLSLVRHCLCVGKLALCQTMSRMHFASKAPTLKKWSSFHPLQSKRTPLRPSVTESPAFGLLSATLRCPLRPSSCGFRYE